MRGRLIKFRQHIRCEHYVRRGFTETTFKRKHECYINPHYVVGIEPRVDETYDDQTLMYVSERDYCRIYTANGGIWEVDGTLEQVAEQVYHGEGIESPAR